MQTTVKPIDEIDFNGYKFLAFKGIQKGKLTIKIIYDDSEIGNLNLDTLRDRDSVTEAHMQLIKMGLAPTSNSRYKLDDWLYKQVLRC